MRCLLLLAVALLGGCFRIGFHSQPDAIAGPDASPDSGGQPDRSSTDRGSADLALPQDSLAPDLVAQPPPWPGFSLYNFKAGWTRPHTGTWFWQCSGDVPDFDHYELCVATDLAGLSSPTARCLNPADDPTLAILECKGAPTDWHLGQANDLEPSTTYYGQLVVVDQHGARYKSAPIAVATPSVPPDRHLIWTEDFLPGQSSWGLKRSALKPAEGSHGLTAEPSSAGAWYEMDLAGAKLVAPGLTDVRFQQAYLEFLIDSPNGVRLHSFFQRDDGANVDYAPPAGYSVADGKPGYQRIEVPLKRMVWRSTGAFLTAADLNAGTLSHVIVGSLFKLGTIYLDEISIRY